MSFGLKQTATYMVNCDRCQAVLQKKTAFGSQAAYYGEEDFDWFKRHADTFKWLFEKTGKGVALCKNCQEQLAKEWYDAKVATIP